MDYLWYSKISQSDLLFKRMNKKMSSHHSMMIESNSSTVIKISFVYLSIKQRRYTMKRNLIHTVVMGKKLGAPLTMPCTEK